ncbi:MAG: beta-hexosaminidase, partial [Lachnospiraceae bacterium]|nr:beta-hexosaminidase [Lachnospiraceae bacterium]
MKQRKGGRTKLIGHPEVPAKKMSVSEYAAREYLQDMSMEQKMNQMIFLHYQGQSVEQLKQYQPGGIILFADFFKGKSRETVIEDIARMQEVCEIPMLVGVDEEGGTVIRVSRYKRLAEEKFRSPQELYAAGGMEEIASDTEKKAALLHALGINVNLAPVADVSVNASDYIYQRTFGKNAEETAEYVATVVEEMQRDNMGSVLKHFPGYGNNRDTHKGFAVDNREYADFETVDFLPFQAGIAAGADSVLVSHNIVMCMDESLPASMSPEGHDILR